MTFDTKKKILDKDDILSIDPNLDILKILPKSISEKIEALVFYKDWKNLCMLTTNNYSKQISQIVERLEPKWYKIEFYYTDSEAFAFALQWYDLLEQKENKEKTELTERQMVTGDRAVDMLKKLYENRKWLQEWEFIEELIRFAFKAWSSDLHFQSEEIWMVVRLRRDWVLKTVLVFDHNEFQKYHIKLKFMSWVKINIDYLPQDWRFDLAILKWTQSSKIDVRVSFMPWLRSENIVMRFLDSEKWLLSFNDIWIDWDNLEVLKKNLSSNYGIILMTWPTWSWKTTTLYSMLNYLNNSDRKIITLEDPVEYELAWIQQSQINYKKWYDYEQWLKSILRQDPDIIMIWEIRTLETAEIAINAALTWHLVISTLHTNSAIEAISRFLNMWVKPYLLASALNLVIWQRLLRRLCNCKHHRKPKLAEQKELETAVKRINDAKPRLKIQMPDEMYYPAECEICGWMWYKWRVAAVEMFDLDETLRNAIIENKSVLDIYGKARESWYLTMKDDAYIKTVKWLTTLEEIRRVL